MSVRRIIGLDIGGANLKRCDADDHAITQPFAVWREPTRLPAALADLCRDLPADAAVGITMTAELCDCFATRSEGVACVLDAVQAAIPGEPWVWSIRSRWLRPDEAPESPHDVAAANWHALATALGRVLLKRSSQMTSSAAANPHRESSASALLVDVGSTTTDIIPFSRHAVHAQGLNDTDRLRHGELVYLGIRRTPVMGCAHAGTLNGEPIPLMNERFATTDDVCLLTGDQLEAAEDRDTADGRPRTPRHAAARLLRMVGADLETHTVEHALELARSIAAEIDATLISAIKRAAAGHPDIHTVWVCGSGSFLAERAARAALPGVGLQRLSERLSPDAAACGPAWAVMRLLREPINR